MGINQYPGPMSNPYPYPPPPNTMGPPIMNLNNGPGFGPPSPPPMNYPNMYPMPPQGPMYDLRPPPYPLRLRRRRPRRTRCRHGPRRCRPVIHIIESDSCSTISSCSSVRSCSPRRYRSCSEPRAAQQQQPIILLPMQYPQQSAIQGQPQQIILPPTQIQQKSFALPAISAPQTVVSGSQFYQAGPIQYVQSAPTSSSQLKPILAKSYLSTAPQHVLVNSSNKKKSNVIKPERQTLLENDRKSRRRVVNWSVNERKKHVPTNNIRIGR
jgi:hypothetical protein